MGSATRKVNTFDLKILPSIIIYYICDTAVVIIAIARLSRPSADHIIVNTSLFPLCYE